MKVRRNFRKFILSRIKESWTNPKDKCYLDLKLVGSGSEALPAHRFILGSLSPFLRQLLTDVDEDPVIVLPDVSESTLRDFLALTYGSKNPDDVDPEKVDDILELCALLQMIEPRPSKTCQLQLEIMAPDDDSVKNLLENSTLEPKTLMLGCGDPTPDLIHIYEIVEQPKTADPEMVEDKSKEVLDGSMLETPEESSSVLLMEPVEMIAAPVVSDEQTSSTRTYECHKCRTQFADEALFKDHMAVHRLAIKTKQQLLSNIIGCGECEEQFDSEVDYAYHVHSAHFQDLVFKCFECDKVFEEPDSLRYHNATVHRTGKKKIQCSKCKEFYRGLSAYKTHFVACTGTKVFDCQYCGKVFNRKDTLMNHLKRHAGPNINCDLCTKVFRTKNDLHKHRKRLHHKEAGLKSGYVIKCNICRRKFTDKGKAYVDHMNRHSESSNTNFYKCDECDKSFATLSASRSHQNWHSSSMSHACRICSKEFKRIQNVRQHIMYSHEIKDSANIRDNVVRLFLSGVDKARAIKEFGEAIAPEELGSPRRQAKVRGQGDDFIIME